jgi:mRNA interferase MazF
MPVRMFFPDRGDIIHLNLSPSAGREMTRPHYALTLSTRDYAKITGTVLVCPITSHVRGWTFEVPLPAGILPPKAGVGEVASVIHADAIRQHDFRERAAALIAKAPPQVIIAVQDLLAEALGIATS